MAMLCGAVCEHHVVTCGERRQRSKSATPALASSSLAWPSPAGNPSGQRKQESITVLIQSWPSHIHTLFSNGVLPVPIPFPSSPFLWVLPALCFAAHTLLP